MLLLSSFKSLVVTSFDYTNAYADNVSDWNAAIALGGISDIAHDVGHSNRCFFVCERFSGIPYQPYQSLSSALRPTPKDLFF